MGERGGGDFKKPSKAPPRAVGQGPGGWKGSDSFSRWKHLKLQLDSDRFTRGADVSVFRMLVAVIGLRSRLDPKGRANFELGVLASRFSLDRRKNFSLAEKFPLRLIKQDGSVMSGGSGFN